MARWRIRINLSDDAQSRARLAEVLASRRVSALQLTPKAGTESVLAGDVVLELPRDDEHGDMLAALHMISPQVIVSRAASDQGSTYDDALAVLAPGDEAILAD